MFGLRMFLMKKEQSDIEQLKKILQDNSSHADLDSFFSAISADYDTYVDKDKIRGTLSKSNLTLIQRVIKLIKEKYDELDVGPKVKNPILNAFINSLFIKTIINKSDLRVLRRFRLLAIDEDELIKLVQPTEKNKRNAIFALSILTLTTLSIGMLVWNAQALQNGFYMVLLTIGTLLGHYIRAAYDSYWGRLRLFNLMRQNKQFFYLM